MFTVAFLCTLVAEDMFVFMCVREAAVMHILSLFAVQVKGKEMIVAISSERDHLAEKLKQMEAHHSDLSAEISQRDASASESSQQIQLLLQQKAELEEENEQVRSQLESLQTRFV